MEPEMKSLTVSKSVFLNQNDIDDNCWEFSGKQLGFVEVVPFKSWKIGIAPGRLCKICTLKDFYGALTRAANAEQMAEGM